MDHKQPEALLGEMERQQLELYLTTSEGSPPSWYFPVLALATAGMFATFDLKSPWLTMVAALLMGAVVGASMRTMELRAGFRPRLSALPRPLRRRLHGYMVGHMLLVLAVLGFAAWGTDHEWRFTIAGAACGLSLWIGATLFEARYRSHVCDLAEQAGIGVG